MANYIKAGGKERPVLFGWGALMAFESRTSKNPFSVFEGWSSDAANMRIADLVELFYCGFENGCYDERKDVDFELRDVANWLNEDGLQARLMKLFTEQMPKGEGEREGEVKAAKVKK